MINEVLEKYSKDIFDVPIWEWLGIKQVTWSAEEKAWLKKQSKPCKANGHYQKTLEFLFGKHRTIKSIDGCWRRIQRNN